METMLRSFEELVAGRYLVKAACTGGAFVALGYVWGRAGRWHAEDPRAGRLLGHAATREAAAALLPLPARTHRAGRAA